MGEGPELEPDPETSPEAESRRARGGFPDAPAPAGAYTPAPPPEPAPRETSSPWPLLALAAVLAAGAAGLWAVLPRGAPAPPPVPAPTLPAPAALEAPPQAQEAIELWLSDTKGDQGDVVEVRVRGALQQRVTLTAAGTLVRVPLAYSGEPVLIEVVMAEDHGGRGVDFRATPVRPLYATVMIDSWIQPYQIWRVTDYPMKARLGRRFHFSNSIEALKTVEPGRGGRQGVTKP